MHNIKLIRKDPDSFIKKLTHRNVKIDIKNLLDLDSQNRSLIQKKEKFEQEKKIISKKKTKLNFLDQKKFLMRSKKLRVYNLKLIMKLIN